jgi:hypothetical protein
MNSPKFFALALVIAFYQVYPANNVTPIADQPEAYWLSVPEAQDAVYTRRKCNTLMYVHPKRPSSPLPKGLFVWQSQVTTNKAYPVTHEHHRSHKAYVWNGTRYSEQGKTRTAVYDPRKAHRIDPSPQAAHFRIEQEEQWKLPAPKDSAPRRVLPARKSKNTAKKSPPRKTSQRKTSGKKSKSS